MGLNDRSAACECPTCTEAAARPGMAQVTHVESAPAQDHVICGPDCQCGCEAGRTIPVRSAACPQCGGEQSVSALGDVICENGCHKESSAASPSPQPTDGPEYHAELAFWRETTKVAALYVEKDGAYFGLPGVDPWDEERDARLYAGPWPVVAHPPCARWSRLAGFVEARWGYKRGDDGGCFEAALNAVRTWGGVLEHPAYSKAWEHFELPKPRTHDGWTLDLFGGASCYVEQRRYGMVTKKPTWLYAFGVELPELRWGFEPDSANRFNSTVRLEDGRRSGIAAFRDRDGNGQTIHTPVAFRDLLLDMARSARMEVVV